MILALLSGAITGWLLGIPIGPLNATVISRTLKHGYKQGLAIGVGAAIMDIIYCGGAAQINQFLVESPIVNLIFELVGFVVLIWLGVRQLRSKPEEDPAHCPPEDHDDTAGDRVAAAAMKRMHVRKRSLFGPFILGIALYATNVLAVPEWIIIAGLWRSWGVLSTGVDVNAAFALGAGVGTAAWYFILVRWIWKRDRTFKPSTLRKIDIGMGVAMLVFGCYFGYEIIFGTHWDQVRSHAKADTQLLIR